MIKYQITEQVPAQITLHLVPLLESENAITWNQFQLSSAVFSGKKHQWHWVETTEAIYLFFGLGQATDYQSIKTAFRTLSHQLKKSVTQQQIALHWPNQLSVDSVEAAWNGFILGTYELGLFKKEPAISPLLQLENPVVIIAPEQALKAIEIAEKLAFSQLETLRLVDAPAHQITPEYLAEWAKKLEEMPHVTTTVFDERECEQLGLHAFLAVGKGSVRKPRFITVSYEPPSYDQHIGMVGKGVTFDTGGLNIKTSGMHFMKSDMAGAAAVLGAIQVAAKMGVSKRITAVVPACENAIGPGAYYPGDVIDSYAGYRIEITDTDAEGRLILADALAYIIKNHQPDCVIDLATLTGSCVGTFGYECAGMFGSDDQWMQRIKEQADFIGERVWPMPLWDAYQSHIESDIADVKNYSGKPVAGAISAAKFLAFFTSKHPHWVHLDIAGVAFGDDAFGQSKHATAYGVHLLLKIIENTDIQKLNT
ncbi:MAG: leucyl aminopeptidase [Flavobacterium sp. BFFFF2]|nr:MAG: leucyl aminopeptidase [Flavobacterium sp. BFFFF2]